MTGLAQLSCQQCQKRKTKCDKTHPCSACSRSGIKCTAVQRQRLPRGRTAKHNANSSQALKDRIEQLEAIISKLQHETPALQPPVLRESRPEPRSPSNLVTLDKYVATNFWTELSAAVAGIKDVLEQDDSDAEPDEGFDGINASSTSSSTLSPYDASSPGAEAGIFGHAVSGSEDEFPVSMETKQYLLHVYKQRVDSIFKPLHWPSTLAVIQSLADPKSDSAVGLENRREIVERVRRAAERAFVQAQILTTTSITVLQAYVVYFAGLRASRANAEQWTLVAVAIRLANAQGIPERLDTGNTSLGMEVRRRLWQYIAVLDLQSAFDRGTQPMIKSTELTLFPLNVHDDSISSLHVPAQGQPDDTAYTGMSLPLSIFQGNVCQRQLTDIGISPMSAAIKGQKQVEILSGFQRHTERLTKICDDSPVQAFAVAVTTASLDNMRLLIHRPLYRRDAGFVPIWYGADIDIDILGTSTSVLEQALRQRSQYQFAPWAWFMWVKWYVLAVVLAELCTAHGPQADHAWEVAKESYDNYATIVADTYKGLLWKPIAKLMRKVRTLREGYNGRNYTNSPGDQGFAESSQLSERCTTGALSGQMQDIHPVPSGDTSLDHHIDFDFGDADIMIDMEGIEGPSWLEWDQLISDMNNNME